jgi:hypothetical protein
MKWKADGRLPSLRLEADTVSNASRRQQQQQQHTCSSPESEKELKAVLTQANLNKEEGASVTITEICNSKLLTMKDPDKKAGLEAINKETVDLVMTIDLCA